MKRLPNLEPFAWIAQQIDPLLPGDHPSWKGNFVSHCLPKGFQSYCKLFHVISEEDPLFLAAAEYTGVVAKRRGKRVWWRDLAVQQGLLFHAEITDHSFVIGDRVWPPHILGPDEGSLDVQTATQLINLLNPFTHTQPCFFRYDLIATQKVQHDFLYVGVLNDLLQAVDLDGVYGTPTHWWPADQSWCIATDWDLSFTLVGGSSALIGALMNDTELECLQVDSTARIDYQGDRLNR